VEVVSWSIFWPISQCLWFPEGSHNFEELIGGVAIASVSFGNSLPQQLLPYHILHGVSGIDATIVPCISKLGHK
jgi:hypothetical protein